MSATSLPASRFDRPRSSIKKTLQNDFNIGTRASDNYFADPSDLTQFPRGKIPPRVRHPLQTNPRTELDSQTPTVSSQAPRRTSINTSNVIGMPRATQAIAEFEMQTAGHREDEQSSQVVVTTPVDAKNARLLQEIVDQTRENNFGANVISVERFLERIVSRGNLSLTAR